MARRWLILADDLTGAADCAIAFARRGATACVQWGEAGPGADEAVLEAFVGSGGGGGGGQRRGGHRPTATAEETTAAFLETGGMR